MLLTKIFLFLFEREGLGSRSCFSLKLFSLLEYKSGSGILNVMLSMILFVVNSLFWGERSIIIVSFIERITTQINEQELNLRDS
jgi:hypothetical protein